MSTGKLKVGIVSANWGAMAHLPAWRTLSDAVEVTSICTSSAVCGAGLKELGKPTADFPADAAASKEQFDGKTTE